MASIGKTHEMPPKNNTFTIISLSFIRFNRMKMNEMIFFTLVKVENPPAVVPSLIRVVNQEKSNALIAIYVQIWGSLRNPITNHSPSHISVDLPLTGQIINVYTDSKITQ